MTPISLKENHRRSLATALGLLDETLCLFEEYARGREVHSILFEERNRLSARQKKDLLEEISRLRAVLQEMKETLGLRVRVVDVGKKIWGTGAGFWEILAELEPKRLRAYGAVPEELSTYLKPNVAALLNGMMRISGLFGSSAKSPDE